MKDSRAQIERIVAVNHRYLQLDLAVEDEALKQIKPGQSLLVRMADKLSEAMTWHPYLREQWWPIGTTNRDVLRVEVPKTRLYEVGQVVQLLGPIGQPFRFRRTLRTVLLIAYNTDPTPLTVMTPQLLKNSVAVSLVLLGDARTYNTDHLAPEIEVRRGDDKLQWEDMVMNIGWADQIFVVVGQDDAPYRMKEVFDVVQGKRNGVDENYLWGVFHPPLPCGVGACDACALKMKEGIKTICTDGPAFDLTQVQLR